MLTMIKKYYHTKKKEFDLKQKLREVFDTLCGYLAEFRNEGEAWALKRALDSSTEYIYSIKVKCSWAKALYQQAQDLHKSMQTHIGKPAYQDDIQSMGSLLQSMKKLLTASVHVVPYSRLDEFNLYIYQLTKWLNQT